MGQNVFFRIGLSCRFFANHEKAEIEDIQEEHRNRMRELEQTADHLMRETRLYSMLIDNFIPPGDVSKIEKRADYDEEKEIWVMQPITSQENMMKRPESAVGNKRPVSRYAISMSSQERSFY